MGEQELWYDDRIFRFEDLVSSGEGRRFPEPTSAGDDSDLALLYTSGTMGKPKGVRLSHRSVIETAVLTGEAIAMSDADRVLVAVPLFAIFGFGVAVGAVAAGATLVLQEEFRAREAIRLIEGERVTVLHGVPTMYHLLMRDAAFERSRLRTLRTGIIAGGPVSEDLAAAFARGATCRSRTDSRRPDRRSPSRARATHPRSDRDRGATAPGRRSEGGGLRHRRAARPRGGRRDRRARPERDAGLCPHAGRDPALVHAGRVFPHR